MFIFQLIIHSIITLKYHDTLQPFNKINKINKTDSYNYTTIEHTLLSALLHLFTKNLKRHFGVIGLSGIC